MISRPDGGSLDDPNTNWWTIFWFFVLIALLYFGFVLYVLGWKGIGN